MIKNETMAVMIRPSMPPREKANMTECAIRAAAAKHRSFRHHRISPKPIIKASPVAATMAMATQLLSIEPNPISCMRLKPL
jgi:hypothetical protein